MGRRGGTLEMGVIPVPSDSNLQTNRMDGPHKCNRRAPAGGCETPGPTELFLAGAQQHPHAQGCGLAQPSFYTPDSQRLYASCLQWCGLWEKGALPYALT